MEKKTYNGWTNFETWKANLEIFDTMNLEDFDLLSTDPNAMVSELASIMEEMTFEMLYNDLSIKGHPAAHWVYITIQEINFHEIAQNKIDQ